MFLWLIRCTEFMYYCKSLFTNNTITRQVLKTLSWPNQYELSLLILGVIRLSRKYDEAQIEHQTAVTQSDSVTPATNCRITCKSNHTTQQTDWGADSIHSYIFFHLFNSRLLAEWMKGWACPTCHVTKGRYTLDRSLVYQRAKLNYTFLIWHVKKSIGCHQLILWVLLVLYSWCFGLFG